MCQVFCRVSEWSAHLTHPVPIIATNEESGKTHFFSRRQPVNKRCYFSGDSVNKGANIYYTLCVNISVHID